MLFSIAWSWFRLFSDPSHLAQCKLVATMQMNKSAPGVNQKLEGWQPWHNGGCSLTHSPLPWLPDGYRIQPYFAIVRGVSKLNVHYIQIHLMVPRRDWQKSADMELVKTWTNNRIEPLSGDPWSGWDCTEVKALFNILLQEKMYPMINSGHFLFNKTNSKSIQ